MCITYFAQHPGCNHVHLVGSFSCGLTCTTDQRHIFYLNDLYIYGCAECRLLSGQALALDPDIVPVEWQPCTQDKYGNKIDPDAVEQVAEEQEDHAKKDIEAQPAVNESEEEEHETQRARRHSAASLSDVDSDTSEWRQDSPPTSPAPLSLYTLPPTYLATPQAFDHTPKAFSMFTGQHQHPSAPKPYYNSLAYRNVTPRRADHMHAVNAQLKHLPVQPHMRPPASPSPSQQSPGNMVGGGRGSKTNLRGTSMYHNGIRSSTVAVKPEVSVPNMAGVDEFPALPVRGKGKE